MHRSGGHLKECLSTSRMDKFAKLKAQPAKKCLFFFLFTYCCRNKKQQTPFHCCALVSRLTSRLAVGSKHLVQFQLYSFVTSWVSRAAVRNRACEAVRVASQGTFPFLSQTLSS